MSRVGTHPKLNGNGEEVTAGLLRNLRATGDTGEVDEAGLNEALLAPDSLQELLGEP